VGHRGNKRGNQKVLEVMKMKTPPTRTYGTQQRQSFIAMNAYIKRTEKSQINDLIL
jgi:hypothetical protein